MPEKSRNKIFEEVPEGADVSGWVRPVDQGSPVAEDGSESDGDTLALTLVYLADQHGKGELTDEEYEAAVEHAQGGGQEQAPAPAQLSLDPPARTEPTLVDTLVSRGAEATRPALDSLLKRARRLAGKKYPPRS